MSETKSSFVKPVTLIGVAIVLGVIVGFGAVYVKGTAPVHAPDEEVAREVSAQDAACALPADKKVKLDAVATGDMAAMIPVSQPLDLNDLAFNGPDERPLTLRDFAGRTVLVNLWATWCVPCREEMPALNALQAKAGNAKFEVVAINVDAGNAEKRKAFLSDKKIDALKDYSEPTLALFNALKRKGLAFGLPVTLLIGDNGCLLSAMNGPANWSSDDAFKFVAEAQGISTR